MPNEKAFLPMKTCVLTLLLFLFILPSGFAIDKDTLFLEKLVYINSGTNNTVGVNNVQKRVKERLENMGFTTVFKTNPKDNTGDLLVATRKGQSKQFITLVMHADTVFEPDSKFSRLIYLSDGKSVTGPGVIDDKGGIIVALNGLEDFLSKNPTPKYSLRVLVSPIEEMGAGGFYEDYRNFSKDSFMVLGFEPALEDGSIIESRRGNRWYHIKITGQEGHAGRAHKESINACHELSIKTDKIQQLTDYNKDLTASIGHLEGGKDKFNIVCGFAEAKIDVRASDFKTFSDTHQKILGILNTNFVKSHTTQATTKTSFTIADDCPPFSATAASKPWIETYLSIVKEIEGKEISAKKSGGAADTNYMSRKGLIIIDGLGAIGSGLHTDKETLLISSLKTRSQALSLFLEKVNTGF